MCFDLHQRRFCRQGLRFLPCVRGRAPKVNGDELSGGRMEQEVLRVPVADTDNVAADADGCQAGCVGLPHRQELLRGSRKAQHCRPVCKNRGPIRPSLSYPVSDASSSNQRADSCVLENVLSAECPSVQEIHGSVGPSPIPRFHISLLSASSHDSQRQHSACLSGSATGH